MKKILLSLVLIVGILFGVSVYIKGGNKYKIVSDKYDNKYIGIENVGFINDNDFIFQYYDGLSRSIIKNGKKYKTYNFMLDIKYSPDGKSFAFVAKKENGKYIVVKDGVESKEYDFIYTDIKYSPDGKSFAFVAKKENGKYIVVKDGIESKEYGIIYENIKYSPDGKSFVFIAEKEIYGKSLIVKDGIEGKFYNSILNMKYSPDGKSFVYIANKGEKYLIVKDGIEGKEYDFIYNFYYSLDGKIFSFIVNDNGKIIIIENGKNLKFKNLVEDNFFYFNTFYYTIDGGNNYFFMSYHLKSYFLKIENKLNILNIKYKTKYYSDIDYTDIKYSSDGKSFAFVAKKENGKYIVVKDGVESKEYDYIYTDIKYSSDGKSFAFVAKKENGKYIVVKDGIESKEYDFIYVIRYTNNGKIISLVENSNKYFVIKEK